MSMTDAEQIATRIQQSLPRIKRGTLRLWGVWFGRPYDNVHTIVDASAQGDTLIVCFDEGEVLYVSSPHDWSVNQHDCRVKTAGRVRWGWFY